VLKFARSEPRTAGFRAHSERLRSDEFTQPFTPETLDTTDPREAFPMKSRSAQSRAMIVLLFAGLPIATATSASAATSVYDGHNRLVSTQNGGKTTTYAYDGLGNLVRRCVNGACTELVVDDSTEFARVVGEIPLGGEGATTTYAYGPTGLAAQGGTTVVYPMADSIGTVRGLVDPSGKVVGRRATDAYGATRALVGLASSIGYAGEFTGAEDGNIWLRARMYDPSVGRFDQRDTFEGFLGRGASLNRYSYTENNPVNRIDPSGHHAYPTRNTSLGYRLKVLREILLSGGNADVIGGEVFEKALEAENAGIHDVDLSVDDSWRVLYQIRRNSDSAYLIDKAAEELPLGTERILGQPDAADKRSFGTAVTGAWQIKVRKDATGNVYVSPHKKWTYEDNPDRETRLSIEVWIGRTAGGGNYEIQISGKEVSLSSFSHRGQSTLSAGLSGAGHVDPSDSPGASAAGRMDLPGNSGSPGNGVGAPGVGQRPCLPAQMRLPSIQGSMRPGRFPPMRVPGIRF